MTDRHPALTPPILGLRGLVFALVLCCLFPIRASSAGADLETADGRRFHDCVVLKADTLGVYFRHSRGIARVLYGDLSDELLAKLGPLPEVEEFSKMPAEAGAVAGLGAGAGDADAKGAAVAGTTQFRLLFYQRVVIGTPQYLCQPGWSNCGLAAGPLRLARYPCRRMAELDFLITSGILPRPPGVVTRQLPRGWRYHF